jgi:TolA-binding protein
MVRFRWFAVRFRWLAILAAAGIGLLGSRPLMAQSQTGSQAELQNEIDQLKRKVEALEAVNAQLQHLDQQVKIVDRKLDQQQSATREEALTRPAVDVGPGDFSFTPRTAATTCISAAICRPMGVSIFRNRSQPAANF